MERSIEEIWWNLRWWGLNSCC